MLGNSAAPAAAAAAVAAAAAAAAVVVFVRTRPQAIPLAMITMSMGLCLAPLWAAGAPL